MTYMGRLSQIINNLRPNGGGWPVLFFFIFLFILHYLEIFIIRVLLCQPIISCINLIPFLIKSLVGASKPIFLASPTQAIPPHLKPSSRTHPHQNPSPAEPPLGFPSPSWPFPHPNPSDQTPSAPNRSHRITFPCLSIIAKPLWCYFVLINHFLETLNPLLYLTILPS